MKRLIASLTLLAAMPVSAACTGPSAPDIPDGSQSDLEAMVASQKEVKAYMEASNEYLDCLDAERMESETAETDTDDERSLARDQIYNAEVDAQEALAEEFNEQIRKYQESNP